MNEAEIASRFIRAAEIDKATKQHVGPAPLRSMPLPYVHDFADKAGWRKEPGDKLEKGDDPLTQERLAFWERLGLIPTAAEITELEGLYSLLLLVDKDEERRALLAWARAKAGGKAFRRWCFQVENIHPETGRRRKDRALKRISARARANFVRNLPQNQPDRVLQSGTDFGHFSGTLDEDVGKRETLNSWAADDAFRSFVPNDDHDFSWAEKRNERRRQLKKKADRQTRANESRGSVKKNPHR